MGTHNMVGRDHLRGGPDMVGRDHIGTGPDMVALGGDHLEAAFDMAAGADLAARRGCGGATRRICVRPFMASDDG